MKAKYSPKWVIQHAVTGEYAALAITGLIWHRDWKHATKFRSHYKAKMAMEENQIFMSVPVEVLPASDRKFDFEAMKAVTVEV